ncbi:MAG: glutamine--fructose-6-phosphate transaminase (isomerizing) [Candidatus Stahlbacteria bacterium]|nr:glutamine--fructose-6-phosphate transaminase (isomerizing) [Candidatus Stahlbacteria bacterium]
MCGIIGYIGQRDINTVLLAGLWKLEYRGYDSAGIAVICDGEIRIRKSIGKLKVLADILDKEPLSGNIGIGHTRWATHGEPSQENAHPQVDCNNTIAVVHNGIIENYLSLKESLVRERHLFRSFTDTEVIPHLIEKYYNGDLLEAVRLSMNKLSGAYAFAVISIREPDKIICVQKNVPLIIGIGEGENLLSSDMLAVLGLTRKVIVLENNEMATLTRDSVQIVDIEGNEVIRNPTIMDGKAIKIDIAGYPHFMLKEIHEQPKVIQQNIDKRLKNQIPMNSTFQPFELGLSESELAKVGRIIIQACGTSWHAGKVGKYLIEKFCRIHTEVDISSEFRYRNPVISGGSLAIAISQSGETADTIAGLREAKISFIRVLSIVNVINSTIARESDDVIYINAGNEIGVASTKAYTAQLFALSLFSLYLSKLKWLMGEEELTARLSKLMEIPDKMQQVLQRESEIINIAHKYYKARNFLFLGRGVNYPSALEGALKLKEISYIHATGLPAGEMKHGPIALIDDQLPVVCINPKGSVHEKMMSNIQEVKARKGKIIAIATEGNVEIANIADDVFYIPDCPESLSPMLVALPLQMLAYHIAVLRGLDVDKPRNLAKSVTVE